MKFVTAYLSLTCLAIVAAVLQAEDQVGYQQDVKPILRSHCFRCHSSTKQEADLRLDSVDAILRGGESGAIVLPGNSADSRMMRAVRQQDDIIMPPEGEPLSDAQIELLRRWVDQSETVLRKSDRALHWSFEKLARPNVPVIARADWQTNPIDAFVAAKYEKLHLNPVELAAKPVLLRRVYLDLIGLPPTVEQLDAFLSDDSPQAFEKVVDELLASPHYGERWGRHWMDVWRYSDWDGYGAEVRESKPLIWKWRDWVLESLNADKPYDRMVVEMLAGDEVAAGDPRTMRATGFLVRNWYKFNRNVWLDSTIEHTGKAFLGLTFNCARCHDHMYDPLTQMEYFQLRAIFEPYDIRTDRVPGQPNLEMDGVVRVFDADPAATTFVFARGDERQPLKDLPLAAGLPKLFGRTLNVSAVSLPTKAYYPGSQAFIQQEALATARLAVDRSNTDWSAAQQSQANIQQKLEDCIPSETSRSTVLDESSLEAGETTASRVTLQAALNNAAAALMLAEKSLSATSAALTSVEARVVADKARYAIPPDPNAGTLALAAANANHLATLRAAEQQLAIAETKRDEAQIAATTIGTGPPNDKSHEEAKKVVTEAEAAVVTALQAVQAATQKLSESNPDYPRFSEVYPEISTGRRLAFANWIANSDNPLTARVAINHMWLRHFGQPLVPTVFDFGLNGQPPTHPELLDWLAAELMSNGWRMKPIHRLIVTSSTYRLASAIRDPSSVGLSVDELDPDNRFLWRQNVRRMEAEVVRDATLYVAGQLDSTMFGPELDPNANSGRRSIYFRSSKEKRVTFLSLFDSPNPVECYRRNESIAPQQALAMSNSPLTLSQSRILARHISEEVGHEPTIKAATDFVAVAFRRILSRDPTPSEIAECHRFLIEQAKRLAQPESLSLFGGATSNQDKAADEPDQHARENLVHVLFNHNDFVTIR